MSKKKTGEFPKDVIQAIKNKNHRNLQLFKDMKDCLTSVGLPVSKEHTEGDFTFFLSEVDCGDYSMHLMALFDPDEEMVTLSVMLSHAVPPAKMTVVCELVNLINGMVDISHFAMHPDTGLIILRNGLFIVDNSSDKTQFQRLLKRLVSDGRLFFPLISDQVFTDLSPKEAVARFLEINKDIVK